MTVDKSSTVNNNVICLSFTGNGLKQENKFARTKERHGGRGFDR